MKHAPDLAERCRPRDSRGIPSGMVVISIVLNPVPFLDVSRPRSDGGVQGDPAVAIRGAGMVDSGALV
jgi:hypothetical protein